MKKQLRKGSMAIETALLMPVILAGKLWTGAIFDFFMYITGRGLQLLHTRLLFQEVWKQQIPDGNSREAALEKRK